MTATGGARSAGARPANARAGAAPPGDGRQGTIPRRQATAARERPPVMAGEGWAVEDRLATMEVVISRLLQLGVVISAAIIALGVALWAITGDPGYPGGGYPITPGAIAAGVVALRPLAIIQVGLFVLLLTPIFRVGASMVLFFHQGDRTFALITLLVLLMLVATLLVGGEAA